MKCNKCGFEGNLNLEETGPTPKQPVESVVHTLK
jgi:hypothetical protein